MLLCMVRLKHLHSLVPRPAQISVASVNKLGGGLGRGYQASACVVLVLTRAM